MSWEDFTMRLRWLTPLALALVLCAPAAQAAETIKDPAALLPGKTMAGLESRQIGPLAKEVAGLLEGSALGNVPESLHKFMGKHMPPGAPPGLMMHGPGGMISGLGAIGLVLASPETVKEFGRMNGIAVALTGFS